ncbi:MAG: hypothetical protein KF878_30165 [Planctomycetes bacterium]|nr:hypothetical protein [Planctomycetota bacterium]
MTPRAVLVRAAARGLVFGVPPALLLGWWSTVSLSPPPTGPPPFDLLRALSAALQGGAPAAACAAACAAVEFAWPRPGARRHDLLAALAALLLGPLAAVAAALQVEYAVGVLTGWIAVFDFGAVPISRLSEALFTGGLLSFVLAAGAVYRRRGDSGAVGCGRVAGVVLWVATLAVIVEVLLFTISPPPPTRFSSKVLELAVAFVTLAAVATVLCAAADAITGGWDSRPEREPRVPGT